MQKYLLGVTILFSGVNSMEKSQQQNNPKSFEHAIEILYCRYLLNRANKNPKGIESNYKYVIQEKNNLIIPTYYELRFKLESNSNQTYSLYAIFSAKKLDQEESQRIKKSLERGDFELKSDAGSVYNFMVDQLVNVVAQSSYGVMVEKIDNQNVFKIKNSSMQTEWFKVSFCSSCYQKSEFLRPSFVCEIVLSSDKLEQLHATIPQCKNASKMYKNLSSDDQ